MAICTKSMPLYAGEATNAATASGCCTYRISTIMAELVQMSSVSM